jgi:mannose-6-phosphate isomerase-like protein (cupin superfamily)
MWHARKSLAFGCLVAALLAATAGDTAQLPGNARPAMTSAQKEQQAFKFLALKMFVEVDSDDTQGAVATLRVFVPPGAGAAPHVHSREDEVFTVLRGHYRFRHGDHEVDAPVGTVLYMPKGVPHTFTNIGSEPGEHLLTVVPGGLEKMFREVSRNQLQMPRDSERVREISARYGLTSLPADSMPLSQGR